MFHKLKNKTIRTELSRLFNSIVLVDFRELLAPLFLDFLIVFLSGILVWLFAFHSEVLPECTVACYESESKLECCAYSLETLLFLALMIATTVITSFLTLWIKAGERFKRSAYLNVAIVTTASVIFFLYSKIPFILALISLATLYFLGFFAYRLSFLKWPK